MSFLGGWNHTKTLVRFRWHHRRVSVREGHWRCPARHVWGQGEGYIGSEAQPLVSCSQDLASLIFHFRPCHSHTGWVLLCQLTLLIPWDEWWQKFKTSSLIHLWVYPPELWMTRLLQRLVVFCTWSVASCCHSLFMCSVSLKGQILCFCLWYRWLFRSRRLSEEVKHTAAAAVTRCSCLSPPCFRDSAFSENFYWQIFNFLPWVDLIAYRTTLFTRKANLELAMGSEDTEVFSFNLPGGNWLSP